MKNILFIFLITLAFDANAQCTVGHSDTLQAGIDTMSISSAFTCPFKTIRWVGGQFDNPGSFSTMIRKITPGQHIYSLIIEDVQGGLYIASDTVVALAATQPVVVPAVCPACPAPKQVTSVKHIIYYNDGTSSIF